MNHEKYTALAKKLKALADRGIDGERENAHAKLSELMLKYGITMDDIEGDLITRHGFIVSKEDEKLFLQTAISVCGNRLAGKTYYQSTHRPTKSMPRKVSIDCTVSDYLEIEYKWGVIKRDYDAQLKLFFHAFVVKNSLFNPDAEPTKWETLTEEQQNAFEEAQRLASGIKASQLHKALQS